jgi:hypothetical protein
VTKEVSALFTKEGKMCRCVALAICVFVFGVSTASADVTIGDTVFANWKDKAYFVGTVVEDRGDEYLVVFEDGDRAVVPETKVREYEISVGAKVMAKWDDKKYYPGTVAKVVGRALYIHYEDGDKRWVPLSWIALR